MYQINNIGQIKIDTEKFTAYMVAGLTQVKFSWVDHLQKVKIKKLYSRIYSV